MHITFFLIIALKEVCCLPVGIRQCLKHVSVHTVLLPGV